MSLNGLRGNILVPQIDRSQATFTQNVLSTFLFQFLQSFSYVATTAIIARSLGPEKNGMVALALMMPRMLVILLSGGINAANVYFSSTRHMDVPLLTRNSVNFAIISTSLGFLIGGILAVTGWLSVLVPGINLWLIMIAMIGLPSGLVFSYSSAILQGLQRIITVNIINLVQSILLLVLTILLVIGFQLGVLGALISSLGSGIISLLMMITILHREGGVFKPIWNPSVIRPVLSFGLRGHIGNVLQFFNYRLDTFILNYMVGLGGVGIYSVSVGLAELLWYFPNAVGFVVFPKAAATRPERMGVFTPRVFGITLGVTMAGAVGLVILGPFLIRHIYSAAFLEAYFPMLVLLPGVILLGGAKVLTSEITGWGYPHYNSFNAGVACILTVILDLILIPRFGILGAAWASSIAYSTIFFMAVGFHLAVRRKRAAFHSSS